MMKSNPVFKGMQRQSRYTLIAISTILLASCTPVLPTSNEDKEIHGVIDDYEKTDTVYHTHTDGGRDMTHADSIKQGYITE